MQNAHIDGVHRTSMLQDLDNGRPMEIDALVTAVQELGRLTGIDTPCIDMVLAPIQQRGRAAGTKLELHDPGYQAPNN